MSVLVDRNTKVVVQGITGAQGALHARACMEYGTQIVAGVTPGKGGQKFDNIPIYNLVSDAVSEAGADTALIFVPPPLCGRRGDGSRRRGRETHYLHHGRYSRVGYGVGGAFRQIPGAHG